MSAWPGTLGMRVVMQQDTGDSEAAVRVVRAKKKVRVTRRTGMREIDLYMVG